MNPRITWHRDSESVRSYNQTVMTEFQDAACVSAEPSGHGNFTFYKYLYGTGNPEHPLVFPSRLNYNEP